MKTLRRQCLRCRFKRPTLITRRICSRQQDKDTSLSLGRGALVRAKALGGLRSGTKVKSISPSTLKGRMQ